MSVNKSSKGIVTEKLVPVIPYVRVVPNGTTKGGKLRATILITPDTCIDTGNANGSTLCLQDWPKCIADYIAGMNYKMELKILPAIINEQGKLSTPCDGTPETVVANFTALKKARKAKKTLFDSISGVWRNSIEEKSTEEKVWQKLANSISLSLGGQKTTVGKKALGEPVQAIPSEDYGDAGQIMPSPEQGTGEEKIKVNTILQVPHADLALALEMQRVEELIVSLDESCGNPNIKIKKEMERERALLSKLTNACPDFGFELSDINVVDLEKGYKKRTKEEIRQSRINHRIKLSDSLKKQREKASEIYNAALPSDDKEKEQGSRSECKLNPGWSTGLTCADAANPEKREAVFKTCCAAHSYATWPQHRNQSKDGDKEEQYKKIAQIPETGTKSPVAQIFYAIQTNPGLARAFGFAFDVEIETGEIVADFGDNQFVYLSTDMAFDHDVKCSSKSKRAIPWTLTKVRSGENNVHFWPATALEAQKQGVSCDAGFFGQYNGLLAMGAGWNQDSTLNNPRFDLTSIDVRTATELELQRRQSRESNAKNKIALSSENKQTSEGTSSSWKDLAYAGKLQTTGLALLCRSAQYDAVVRLAANTVKQEAGNGKAKDCGTAVLQNGKKSHVVFDANDLTTGNRLYAGTASIDETDKDRKIRTNWHELMGRFIKYGGEGRGENGDVVELALKHLLGGTGSDQRIEIESAFMATPARTLPTGEKGAKEVTVEQATSVWDGSPLGVDCSVPSEHKNNVEDTLSFGRELHLLKNQVPKLRYGWPYRFAMAAVYSGGRSRAPEKNDVHVANFQKLFYPPVAVGSKNKKTHVLPFFRFLRQSKIDAPVVLLPDGHAARANGPMGYEHGRTIIVRSIDGREKNDKRLASRATPEVAQRLIMIPSVSLDEAARHGVFDDIYVGRKSAPPGHKGIAYDDRSNNSFPVTCTFTQKGIDDRRFIDKREIHSSPTVTATQTDFAFGDSVYKASSKATKYYPDPAADYFAIGIRKKGETKYLNKDPIFISAWDGRKENKPSTDGSHLPMLLTVKTANYRQTGKPLAIKNIFRDGLPGKNYAPNHVYFNPSNRANVVAGAKRNHKAVPITLTLAPGDAIELDVWAVPSAVRLAREFSLTQSLGIFLSEKGSQNLVAGVEKSLPEKLRAGLTEKIEKAAKNESYSYVGPGGAIAPNNSILKVLGEELHKQIKCHPLTEISSITTLEITHATNRAANAPTIIEMPLADQTNLKYRSKNKKNRNPVPIAASRPKSLVISDDDSQVVSKAFKNILSPGSTEFALHGEVELDLDAIDTIEVTAKAALPASSAFDDKNRGRSLAMRRAGLWPKIKEQDKPKYKQAEDIFGFKVAHDGRVEHTKSDVLLLRVERLLAGATDQSKVNLEDFFFEKKTQDPKKQGGHVSYRHIFPDGRARILDVQINGLSRTAGMLKTADRVAKAGDPWLTGEGLVYKKGDLVPGESLSSDDQKNLSEPVRVILPATFRPAKCDARAPVPVLKTQVEPVTGIGSDAKLRASRSTVVRIPLGREWFSTGEEERVGVVVWPPMLKFGDNDKSKIAVNKIPIRKLEGDTENERLADLSGFTDEDLGEGGGFITRRGGDPVRGGGEDTAIFLSLADFLDLNTGEATYVPNVEMPLGDNTNQGQNSARSKTPPMIVGLVTYEPRFDPEREEWYIDVAINSRNASDPFVRFGLVRYQPHTIRELQVSRPVVQWTQLLPERNVEVSWTKNIKGEPVVQLQISGQSSTERKKHLPAHNAPVMKVVAFEKEFEKVNGGSDNSNKCDRKILSVHQTWPPTDNEKVGIIVPDTSESHSVWKTEIPMNAFQRNITTSLHIEEIERFRPASYGNEPVDAKTLKNKFIDTGPRFAVTIEMEDLLKVLPVEREEGQK